MIVLTGVVRWGLYLILLTPLLLSTRFISPFLTAKVLSFQGLVDIVVGAAAGLYLLQAREGKEGNPTRFLPGKSPLLAALSLYLAYALVASLFGVDLNRSLWGIADRQDGLVLQLHFFTWLVVLVWFYLGQEVAPSPQQPPNLNQKSTLTPLQAPQGLYFYLKLSFWISAAVAATTIYAWLEQHFRLLGLVPENVKESFEGRVGGVFGNPTFVGPYFLFHFFYGTYLLSGFFHVKSDRPASGTSAGIRRPKSCPSQWSVEAILILIAQCAILSAVLLGQVRGVLLGLIAGFLVVAICMIISRSVDFRLRIAAAVFVGIIIAGSISLWQFRGTAVEKSIPFLKRLTESSFTELSVSSRLTAWESALSAIEDHPLVGWGENNIYYGLNKYYNPALVRFDPYETQPHLTWYDKSHNAYLDLLAGRGMIGTILFLVLAAVGVRSLLTLNDRYLAFFIAGSLTACLAADFVAFDTFGSFFPFYLSLAPLLLSDCQKKPLRSEPADAGPTEGDKSTARTARLLGAVRRAAAVFVVPLSLCGLYVNLEMGMASIGYQDAQVGFAQDPGLGLHLYEASFQYYSPYQMREKLHCATLIAESVLNKRPIDNASIGRALRLAKEAAGAFPKDVSIFLSLADMCNNLALYFDKSLLDEAERFGLRALELSPKRQEAIFCLGRTYILRNEAPRAVYLNKQMVADYPAYPLAHWFLGLSLIADDKRDEAKLEIHRAFELGFRFRNAGEANVVRDLFGEDGYYALIR